MSETDGKAGVLSSLVRFFDVLEYLDTMPREVSIRQVSEDLSINKATVYRILKTMCERGYAYQNPDNKKYALTLALFHIGFRVKNKMPVSQLISPYYPMLDRLRDKYGESINISMLDKHSRRHIRLTNIVSVKSDYMLRRIDRDISSMPAHASASGKCLMAYAPKSFIDQFRGSKLETPTVFTIDNWNDLDEELRRIRENGYSVCTDEHEIGIACIAVPVITEGNTVPASVSMSGETERMKEKDKIAVVSDLQILASQLANVF